MDKWTIVILGISGDLSKRKILPALYALVQQGEPLGLIIGTGRDTVSIDELLERALPFVSNYQEESWNAFKELLSYAVLDFKQGVDFTRLEATIAQEQEKRGLAPAPRLFYLATAADYFCIITDYLVQSGALVPHNKDYRIVYEKPFGWDLESAAHINSCIKHMLSETQVYRIDHYLAKEFVSNLLLMRYANTLFKSIWNNRIIDAIQIFFHETGGIQGRGEFYDRYGLLNDVVQNHVLQILALVTMDIPPSLDADSIRDKKAEILRTVHVVNGVLGQYEGYTHEHGVGAQSKTETYAALKLFVDHPHWYGVPFYVEAGKELDRKSTEVRLILKPVSQCLWSEGGECQPNVLTIRITPQEGFSLQVNTKKPGTLNEIATITLNFMYTSIFGPTSVEAYEVLFKEIMKGQQTLAVRFDEIEYQWSIIEKIKEMNLPLFIYPKGSERPKEAFDLMHERGL